MNKVIVLGYRAGLERALLEMGYEIYHIVTKIKPALTGKPYTLVDNLEDGQQVLRAALAHVGRHVEGVVTASEDGVYSAALLRTALNLPGDRDFLGILRFRDKFLQKYALPEKVSYASCMHIRHDATFDDLAIKLGTPFIVKPANGAGSVQTAIVNDSKQFEQFYSEAIKDSDIKFVAEELIDGVEFHADGVWADGRLAWLSIGQYSINLIQTNNGSTFGSQLLLRQHEAEMYQQVEALCESVLPSLSTGNMVFHLEYFKTDQRLVFSECAARIAGALVPEIIGKTYAFDYYQVQAAIGLGLDPTPYLPHSVAEQAHAFVYLRDREGQWVDSQSYRQRFDFVEMEYPESRETKRIGIYGKIGHVIMSDRDPLRLKQRICDVVKFNEVGHG